MSKYLDASRVKDGWLVRIIKTEHAYSTSEVLDIIRHEGLKIRTKSEDDKGETIVIFAD